MEINLLNEVSPADQAHKIFEQLSRDTEALKILFNVADVSIRKFYNIQSDDEYFIKYTNIQIALNSDNKNDIIHTIIYTTHNTLIGRTINSYIFNNDIIKYLIPLHRERTLKKILDE